MGIGDTRDDAMLRGFDADHEGAEPDDDSAHLRSENARLQSALEQVVEHLVGPKPAHQCLPGNRMQCAISVAELALDGAAARAEEQPVSLTPAGGQVVELLAILGHWMPLVVKRVRDLTDDAQVAAHMSLEAMTRADQALATEWEWLERARKLLIPPMPAATPAPVLPEPDIRF